MQVQQEQDGGLRIADRTSLRIPLLMWVLAVLAAVLSVDVFLFRCERSADVCHFNSHSVIGNTSGTLQLSQIDHLDDQSWYHRGGGRSQTLYERVQHAAVLTDGTKVQLEAWSRTTMVGVESLRPGFVAFQQSQAETFWFPELHFGAGGLAILITWVLGAVALVLTRRVVLHVDPAGQMTFRRRGVIGGFRSWTGSLSDLEAIGVNGGGSYPGTYLRMRDGAQLKLAYGNFSDAGPANDALSALSKVPITEITDADLRNGVQGTNPLPAIGCMLSALSPFAIPCVWGVLSALFYG